MLPRAIPVTGLVLLTVIFASGCTRWEQPINAGILRNRILPPQDKLTTKPTPAERTSMRPGLLHRDPINLRQAIHIAMANNHTLRLAREDVGIAQQQVYVARSLFLPQVTAGYGYDIRDREVQMAVEGTVFPAAEKEFQHAELKIQMTIWDFGRTLGKYDQACFGREIAALQRRRIEQGVTFQITKAYFDILRARKAEIIAKEGVEQARAHLKTAQSLFRNGVVDKNDVLRAEVQVAEVRQQLITAENAVELATSVFNSILGINVNHPTEVVDVTEAPKCEITLITALQTAIEHRPEFEIVQKSIRLEEAGITAARSEFLPKIFVAGSLNRLDDKYQVHKNSAIGEIGISMDLFSGGRKSAQYHIARRKRRKAAEVAKQVCDGIALEVKQALLGITGARKRLAVAEKAVSQAKENLRLVNNKYQQTAATSTDVVDAETLKTRAQRNHYAALYGLIVAVDRLKFATGTICDITNNNTVQNSEPPKAK